MELPIFIAELSLFFMFIFAIGDKSQRGEFYEEIDNLLNNPIVGLPRNTFLSDFVIPRKVRGVSEIIEVTPGTHNEYICEFGNPGNAGKFTIDIPYKERDINMCVKCNKYNKACINIEQLNKKLVGRQRYEILLNMKRGYILTIICLLLLMIFTPFTIQNSNIFLPLFVLYIACSVSYYTYTFTIQIIKILFPLLALIALSIAWIIGILIGTIKRLTTLLASVFLLKNKSLYIKVNVI